VTDLVVIKCTQDVHMFVATEGRAVHNDKKFNHQLI